MDHVTLPPRRPGAVTAAAVLCIIYGSLGTLCGLCGAANIALQGSFDNMMGANDPVQKQMQEKLQKAMDREIPGNQAYTIVGTLVGLVESISLTGIGQAIYQGAFVMPAMNQAFGNLLVDLPQGGQGPPPGQVLDAMRVMMTMVAVAVVIIYGIVVIYLTIIIVLLTRPHVKAAFAGTPSDAGRDPDDNQSHRPRDRGGYEDDQDWNRPPPGNDPRDERIR